MRNAQLILIAMITIHVLPIPVIMMAIITLFAVIPVCLIIQFAALDKNVTAEAVQQTNATSARPICPVLFIS